MKPVDRSDSNFSRMLRAGRFAVTVEVGPPAGPTTESITRQIGILRGYADAYNVTDNQAATVHMSSLATCIMLKQAGMEPVLQLTCRDRNRLALQSDLVGAAGHGIANILALSGDHIAGGDHPQAKPVYDLDSINLVRMARMMRDDGVFENGKPIPKAAPDFFIGAVANPFAPPYDFRPLRLAKKVAAGAQFIQTQLIFNVPRFREFMARVVDLGLHEQVYILAGVGPVRSLRAAHFMRDQVAGLDVPDWVVARLEGLPKAEQQRAGLELCIEIAQQVREIEGVAGLHIMAVGWPSAIPPIVEALGLHPRPLAEPLDWVSLGALSLEAMGER